MKAFATSVLGLTTLTSTGLVALGLIYIGYAGLPIYLPGLLMTQCWVAVNSIIIYKMLQLLRSGTERDHKVIRIALLVKFPLLYLAGLGILIHCFSRLEGVILGFTVYLISFVGIWLMKKMF